MGFRLRLMFILIHLCNSFFSNSVIAYFVNFFLFIYYNYLFLKFIYIKAIVGCLVGSKTGSWGNSTFER